jgi:hypothetical protein
MVLETTVKQQISARCLEIARVPITEAPPLLSAQKALLQIPLIRDAFLDPHAVNRPS